MIATRNIRILLASLALVTAACATEKLPGGSTNSAPVAVIDRAEIEAFVDDLVVLDGSASRDDDDDILQYEWSLIAPASSDIELSSPDYVTTKLRPDVPGEYRVSLVVDDGIDRSSSATAVILVAEEPDDNQAPVAAIDGPTAVSVGELVSLSGTQSIDPDGDGLFYDWILEGGPDGTGARIDDPLGPNAVFTPDLPGVYEISLVVSDGRLSSDPVSTQVTAVSEADNAPPVADAGSDQQGAVGTAVVLDGSASSDPEGNALSYSWSVVAAPASSAEILNDSDTATPALTIDAAGSYVVELQVSDGVLADTDTVTVTAVTQNNPPLANAGPDLTGRIGEAVALTAAASSDPDGDVLSFAWSITTRPSQSAASVTDATASSAQFVPDLSGVYVATVTVDDGIESASDDVRITVQGRHPQSAGDVVITEIMADPTVLTDTTGEWLELHNPTGLTWDLRDCQLGDDDLDDTMIDASLNMAPDGYVTLARSANPGFAADYVYSGFSLSNGDDEIVLTCGGTEIARVNVSTQNGFSSSAPPGRSRALLRNSLNETANDDGANWCESTADYNGDKGTPGAPNEFQSACP